MLKDLCVPPSLTNPLLYTIPVQYLRQCQKIVVSGMRYDFPKLRYYWVSGNPLRYIPETNIKLAKVLL